MTMSWRPSRQTPPPRPWRLPLGKPGHHHRRGPTPPGTRFAAGEGSRQPELPLQPMFHDELGHGKARVQAARNDDLDDVREAGVPHANHMSPMMPAKPMDSMGSMAADSSMMPPKVISLMSHWR